MRSTSTTLLQSAMRIRPTERMQNDRLAAMPRQIVGQPAPTLAEVTLPGLLARVVEVAACYRDAASTGDIPPSEAGELMYGAMRSYQMAEESMPLVRAFVAGGGR